MERLQPLRLIWFAFIMSHLVFQVVITVLGPQPGSESDPSMFYALLVPGVLAPLFGQFGVPLVLHQMHAQAMFLIRWALIESMVVMGFVSVFLDLAPLWASWATWAVSLLLMLANAPTEERFTAWEVDRLGKKG